MSCANAFQKTRALIGCEWSTPYSRHKENNTLTERQQQGSAAPGQLEKVLRLEELLPVTKFNAVRSLVVS